MSGAGYSLVPRIPPDFRRLQYGKTGSLGTRLTLYYMWAVVGMYTSVRITCAH